MPGGSSFAQPWLVWLLVGLLVVVLAAGLVRWRRSPHSPTYVAHADRLRSLPRYRALVVRRVIVSALATVAAVVACIGGIILSGRVQETQTREQDDRTRDIMLCLDASGSMSQVNAAVVKELQRIVAELRGERIGMTIWNGVAVTVLPLTDDYAFVQEELARAQKAFATEDYTYTYGLDHPAGSSLIGDGLVSCVQRFDRPDEERGRAIVMASDNAPYGRGVYTFQEAKDYAVQHGVIVHGIAAPHTDDVAFASEEFAEVATATGGTYHLLDDGGSAAPVVEAINTLEATKIDKPPLVQVLDRPRLGKIIAGIGVGLLALVWAVQAGIALSRRRTTTAGRPS